MSCSADFYHLIQEVQADTSLDLEGIATSNVDATLAEVQIVACQRCNKNGSIFIGVDCAARGELMRDANGRLEMTDGFRVLIDIEKFSGRDVMAALD